MTPPADRPILRLLFPVAQVVYGDADHFDQRLRRVGLLQPSERLGRFGADDPAPLAQMLLLSGAFILLTFVVFVIYGLFAASVRSSVISRPRVLAWMRRAFAAAFVALGAKLVLAER